MPARTIRGTSLRDALSRVRAELGPDAVILETRELPEVRSGQGAPYEVLASPVTGDESLTPRPALDGLDDVSMLLHTLATEMRGVSAALRETPDGSGMSIHAMVREHFEELKDSLAHLGSRVGDRLDHGAMGDPFVHGLVIGGVEPVLARILCERARARAAPARGLGVARAPDLRAELAHALAVAPPLWARDGRAVIALVGPTGVGKTRTIAKLATLTTFVHNRPVGVISTDVKRIGAVETLRAISSVAGVRFESAHDAPALSRAVRDMGRRKLVLIDTPGVSPWDDEGLMHIDELLAGTSVERHLVLTADTTADRARMFARRFGGAGLRSVIVTKVDESDGPGSVLSSVWGTGLPVSHTCDGQDIPDRCNEIELTAWAERVTGPQT